MPPGKRWEVLVTFPDAVERTFRTLDYNQGGDMYPNAVLAQITSGGRAVEPIDPLPVGTELRPPDPFMDRPTAAQRLWEFTEDDDAGKFFINGKEFDPNRVDVSPQLGTVEEWTLRNSTMEQHPFHIHVNDFVVVSVGGVPYEARGDQDTVILPPGEDVVVRIPFDDFPGRFVFHCHILAHEDGGMMAVVDVIE
jgi:FtsP/CotA-like multicopper oxidase with cupredoxin domain